MIINLNNNPSIIVKPDYQPVSYTGNTPTVLIGSGYTTTTNVSGNTWIVYSTGSTGGGTWGTITGTLSDQTDLQDALDGKLDNSVYQADMLIISDEIDTLISGQTLQGGQISTLQSDMLGKLDTSVYQSDMVIIGGEIDDNYNAFTGHTSDLSIHQTKTILQGSGNTSVNNVSGNTWVIYSSGSTGGGTWGSISGTLSDQTDLQSALDGKSATGHTHDYTGSTILNKPSFVGSGNTNVTLSGNTYVIYSPTGSTLPTLLPSRAIITNNAGELTTANTTSTEIAYLFGVTSSVQSQLNGKSATNHTHSQYITGATNLGTGTTIYTNVSSAKVNLKSITSTNLTLSNNSNEINIAAGSIAPKNYWSGTQAAYNALGSYDANTIYFIV